MTSGPEAMLARQGEHTVKQAAKLVGRSPDTIRRWIRKGDLQVRRVKCGDLEVVVFNDEELKALREYSKTIKLGRPPVGLRPMTKREK